MDTERDTTPATRADDAVFGRRPMGTAGRWWRGSMAVMVISAAVFVAWYASRDRGPSAEADGHVHGAAADAGTGEPVMHDAEQARRIGETFATVERTVLRQEVRSVAQVTVDPLLLQPDDADWYTAPAGRVSDTVTPVSWSGPVLVT
jgi:hypothetical protein